MLLVSRYSLLVLKWLNGLTVQRQNLYSMNAFTPLHPCAIAPLRHCAFIINSLSLTLKLKQK
jgi:hypothetical protein